VRAFDMIRDEDVSGVSGTGLVGEAIEFSDGTAVVRWLTQYKSTVFYESILVAERIHGHDGRTRFVPIYERSRSDKKQS